MIRCEVTIGDTLTPLGMQLMQKNTAGILAAVDLTDKSVRFKMVSANGEVIVEPVDGNATITDEATGKVQYDFEEADVDTPGTYYAWFLVYNQAKDEHDTYPTGKRQLAIVVSAAA